MSNPSPPRRSRPDSLTMASGALAASLASPLLIFEVPPVLELLRGRELEFAILGCASFALAALVIVRAPFFGRTLASLAIALFVLGQAPALLASPAVSLLVAILLVSSLAWLWGAKLSLAYEGMLNALVGSGYLRGATFAAVACWVHWLCAGARGSATSLVPVLWAGGVAAGLGFWRVVRRFPEQPRTSGAMLFGYGVAILVGAIAYRQSAVVVTLPVVCALVVGATLRRKRSQIVEQGSFWEPLLGHPERLFVGTFAFLTLLGSALLALPAATTRPGGLDVIDALFTSTSAVCVTGLSTIDPAVDLTVLGQVVVLLLIQIGGLGIMTFSTVLLFALGRRMSLRHEGAVASLLSPRDRGRLFDAARRIIEFTMLSELVGALALAVLFFSAGDPLSSALWRGLFTSISAFCNAGFALQSDSLVSYQTSPLVLHTVALLIMLGGISPLAAFAVPELLARGVRPTAVQAKLSLAVAGVLLVIGFVLILAFEWRDSLAGLSLVDKLHNAWFQSVTLRTAGFNSVDLKMIQPATLTLMIIWMFIGGSPGSTAGGVKTTTVAILFLSVLQTIRGKVSLEVFGRTIPDKTKTRAVAVVCIAAFTGVLALLALQLTQDMPEREIWFEVFSALGTVGLTIGGTGRLDTVGKMIIIVCMFVGRVGGLTLLMFLSNREFVPKIGRPEEEVDVG